MPQPDRAVLNALLRSNLASFIQRCFQTVSPGDDFQPNWHIEAIAWHLEECLHGRIRRLIITLPPRNLKSICASVAYPAWVLGLDPTRRVICPSYSEILAGSLSRDCRSVVQSIWYQEAFPRTRISPSKNTELEFVTTAGGFRLATSVGGTLTGRGGNLIVIDDPMKPDEALSTARREAVNQWYDTTLYTRLDNKAKDVIVLVMQRLHVDDLVGHVLGKEPWAHLDLPAVAEKPQRIRVGRDAFHERKPGELLHPDREPRVTLDQLKISLGTHAFSAQYLQNPIPPEGNLIQWKWFRSYKRSPGKEAYDWIVQSWDTASKAEELRDYSVCTTWLRQGNRHYLIDVVRERLEYPFLKKRAVDLARQYEADAVLIEDKGSGTQLIQDLQHEGLVLPIAILPEGDKVTRMSAQSAKIEAGCVFLPEEAPWLGEFEREVLQFPNGKFDDQVDSMSQYLGWREQEVPYDEPYEEDDRWDEPL